MVSGIPPVDITQNEPFLSCDTVLLGVRFLIRDNYVTGRFKISALATQSRYEGLELQTGLFVYTVS
jgi:hypothetical protein